MYIAVVLIFNVKRNLNLIYVTSIWILVNGILPLHFGKRDHWSLWSLWSPLCTLVTVVPLCTLVNFGDWGLPFALWSLWSPLCTLVNFGEWGPPFALCWILVNGVPPLHFHEFWWMGPLFALWWMGFPLCTMVNGVPPLHLRRRLFFGFVSVVTYSSFLSV